MQRILKWMVLTISILTAGLAAGYFFLFRTLDLENFRPALERQLTANTGRPFQIGGEWSFSLFPVARFSFSDLRMAAPEGFAEKHLLTIQSCEIRLKPFPLLFRELQVQRIFLRHPRLVLETQPGGRKNWETVMATASVQPAGGETAEKPSAGHGRAPAHAEPQAPTIKFLDVARVTIADGSLLWIDGSGGIRHTVNGIDMVLRGLAPDRPLPLKLSAQLDGRRFGLKGHIGPLAQDKSARSVALDLDLSLPQKVEGRIKGTLFDLPDNPRWDLAVESAPFDPRLLAEAAGMPFLPLAADPKTLESLSVKGRLTGNATQWQVKDGVLALDAIPLRFKLTFAKRGLPNLKLDLHCDEPLDLDTYLPAAPARQMSGGRPATPAISTNRTKSAAPSERPAIDRIRSTIKSLHGVSADIALRFKNLTIRHLPLRDLGIELALTQDILQVKQLSGRIFEGRFQGQGALDMRKGKPALDAKFQAEQIDVGRLLSESKERVLVEGRAEAEVALKIGAASDSELRPLRLLEGKGQVVLTDGALRGFDIGAMLHNREGAFGLMPPGQGDARTEFSRLSLPVIISHGVLTTRDARLDSPTLKLIATGSVDLADRELGLLIAPRPDSSVSGTGKVLVPVMVSGTFEVPVFRPDLRALANRKLDKKILNSKKLKKAFERPELKPYEEKVKNLLKDLVR